MLSSDKLAETISYSNNANIELMGHLTVRSRFIITLIIMFTNIKKTFNCFISYSPESVDSTSMGDAYRNYEEVKNKAWDYNSLVPTWSNI